MPVSDPDTRAKLFWLVLLILSAIIFRKLEIIISNAKSFVSGTFHGLDQKHFQGYLDEFCYRFNRRFWEGQLFNRLLAACSGYPPTTYAELTQ